MSKLAFELNITPTLNKSELSTIAKIFESAFSGFAAPNLVDDKTSQDAKSYSDNIKRVREETDKLNKGMLSTVDATKEAASQGTLFTKAFNFNQIFQSVTAVTQAFDQFIGPYKEFDKQLKNIGTLGVKNFEEFRNKAIDLAASVPDTVAGVTEGVYNAISAGAISVVDGMADVENGMKFVEQASQLAVAGLTDTNAAIKGLAAVTNAYGPAVLSPANAADILFGTVKNGVTTIEELNSSMSNVVPVAAAAGVSFEQVGAAFATMTKQGTPTAEASTKIRAAIAELLKPGAELKKVMAEAGVSMETLKQDGLQTTMKKLGEAMDRMGTNSANTFSSIEAIQFALATTGDNAVKAAADLQSIQGSAGSVKEAFEIANTGIGVQVQGILNQIEALAFKAFGALGDGVTIMMGAANQIAPIVTAFAGLSNIIPDGSIAAVKNYAGVIANSLVPGLITYDATTKKAVFNTNALTLANLRQNVASKASAAMSYLQATATGAATVAQNLLNAAFIASPVGWIVAGIAGLVAVMVLLYKNVEPVRKVFDATFDGIVTGFEFLWDAVKIYWGFIKGVFTGIIESFSTIGDGIAKLFSGDFSGAFESFSKVGSNASEAFMNEFEKGISDVKTDRFTSNLQEAIKDGAKISLQINEAESYKNAVDSYEKTISKLNALKQAKTQGTLTESEQKEFEELEVKAEQLKNTISGISPEVKKNVKYVVDDTGQLTEVYDINIAKAKELGENNLKALDISDAKDKFTKNVLNMTEEIGKQNDKLKTLQEEINKTEDPQNRQKLLDSYREQLEITNQNKESLLASFKEGALAGMATEESINAIAKSLGITNEKTKEMLLSEELKQASKEGELTSEQIEKIAQKYGIPVLKAQEMLNLQKKQTEEASKTGDEVKKIGAEFDKTTQNLKEGFDNALSTVAALRKKQAEGVELNQTEKDLLEENIGVLEENSKELQSRDKILKNLQDQYKTTYETASKSEKQSASVQKTAYETAKKKYDIDKALAQELTSQYEIEKELAILSEGRLVSENEKTELQIDLLKRQSTELARQYDEALKLKDIALLTTDPTKQAEQLADAEKILGEIKQKISENKKNTLVLEIRTKADREQALEEINKLRAELAREKLEYDVEIGFAMESDLLKDDIATLNNQIDALKNKIGTPQSFGMSQEDIQKAQVEIEKLQQQLYEKSVELDSQLTKERIENIENEIERERELKEYEALQIFNAEMKLAESGAKNKEAVYRKYTDTITEINREYIKELNESSQSAANMYAEMFGSAFSNLQFSVPDNSATLRDIEEQRKALRMQYKEGEIDKEEYYDNLKKLDEEYKKNTTTFWQDISGTIADGFAAISEQSQTTTNEALQKWNTYYDEIDALAKKKAENDEKIKQAQIEGNEDLANRLLEDNARIADAIAQRMEYAAEKVTEAWQSTGIGIAVMTAQMVISGKNATEALVMSALKGLQAMIPIFVAKIYGNEFATKGPLGIAVASGLVGILTAYAQKAFSKAKATKYKTGGYRKDGFGIGEGLIPAGMKHIIVNDEYGKPEFISNATTTAKNLKHYEYLNKHKISLEEYVVKNETLRNIITEKLLSNIVNFTNNSESKKYLNEYKILSDDNLVKNETLKKIVTEQITLNKDKSTGMNNRLIEDLQKTNLQLLEQNKSLQKEMSRVNRELVEIKQTKYVIKSNENKSFDIMKETDYRRTDI